MMTTTMMINAVENHYSRNYHRRR